MRCTNCIDKFARALKINGAVHIQWLDRSCLAFLQRLMGKSFMGNGGGRQSGALR